MDKKFSQGDANSDAYRANWDSVFGAETQSRHASPSEPSGVDGSDAGSTEQGPAE